jgi:hypothetical protein
VQYARWVRCAQGVGVVRLTSRNDPNITFACRRSRPPNRLTTAEAARRFGQPLQKIVYLCRTQNLAIAQPGAGGRYRIRYMIDPAQLGVVLDERIDRAAAAERFALPRVRPALAVIHNSVAFIPQEHRCGRGTSLVGLRRQLDFR